MASIKSLLFPIKKDIKTLQTDIITNITKMLVSRKWLDKSSEKSTIENLLSKQQDNDLYIINIDNELTNDEGIENFNGSKVIIKILHQKITGLNKTPIINDFITMYKLNHKILIVDSITEKPRTQLYQTPHTEIFNESEFLLNLLDHECSPKYEILSSTEKENVMNTYQITKKQMKKIYDSDMASRYFYLKPLQVIKIIRNSSLSGYAVDYRIVIHRSISIR